jgi:type IV pilus assembly protein PilC
MEDNKQLFKWKGMNAQGERKEGDISATDIKEAQIKLQNRKIEVISLAPKAKIDLGSFFKKKPIKPKDILLFTRYLSTMITARLTIVQALDIIGHDQEKPAMQSLILSIKSNVVGGKTLAESFALYPDYFPDLYCNLIKAGEKSGTLDKILNRLASYQEKTANLKRKIRKALIYPVAVMIIALIVSLILLIFVVPQFQAIFKTFGSNLPFFTQMIVHLSNGIRTYWLPLVGAIVFIVMGLRYWSKRSSYLSELWDRYSLRLIIVGGLLRKSMIARYTQTLATTLDAGMPIIESMKSVAPIMGNSIYSKAVMQICDNVRSGSALSVSMSSTKLFPNMVIQMIAVGEAAGALGTMLNKIADYYEEEVNSFVDNLSSLIEPLIMAVLGVVIGSFVIAMYLPIFKLGNLF